MTEHNTNSTDNVPSIKKNGNFISQNDQEITTMSDNNSLPRKKTPIVMIIVIALLIPFLIVIAVGLIARINNSVQKNNLDESKQRIVTPETCSIADQTYQKGDKFIIWYVDAVPQWQINYTCSAKSGTIYQRVSTTAQEQKYKIERDTGGDINGRDLCLTKDGFVVRWRFTAENKKITESAYTAVATVRSAKYSSCK